MAYVLHQLLVASARRIPDKTAVIFNEHTLSYAELDALTDQLAGVLRAQGVTPGNRVGIYVSKSLASVVSVFAILKTGACYVPLDPGAPVKRLAYIIRDSGITTLLTSSAKATNIQAMFPDDCPLDTVVLVDCDLPPEQRPATAPVPQGVSLLSWNEVIAHATAPLPENLAIETDTAYILYTSGSTGTPKGVMISHRNSLTFVNWAADCVGLSADDRVSSHAPLHFDLSIFDIFSSCLAGATIILVPEGASTFPVQLTRLIERERISVWYSVPSVLTLMVLYGQLATHDLSCLRTIIFAGEVFPVKYLRQLMTALPQARYLNWYGPTETNVCTFYEVPPLDPERTVPIPIGKACANTEIFAVNSAGEKVTEPGESGELYVRGPSLMQGYWGHPEKTAKVLMRNPFQPHFHELMYKTGDIVTLDADGNYLYLGREDGMIKTRGYRVELGEIEAVLYGHPAIREVAVLPVPDEVLGNRLRAVISLYEGATLTREEVLSFCHQQLPHYMVPDMIEFREVLPKTSTGKTDRVSLARSFSA
ncbi:MAG TPA: amino acid adenylation domain-containing protein [Ktedonobacteraceae bacterium]|jgi:amino acid adenylation domain-containing protein|nr:amino acid adenylation domain-containing protein [Ktedonobacteraceae bacterium]